jgi:hypothetical protein
MRITYRTLFQLIDKLSEEQKDKEVTVDVWDGVTLETYGAEFRIVNEKHESLDSNHPVICVNQVDDLGKVINDVDWISKSIGIIKE